MLKNLTLTKCQGTRWYGDNPLAPYNTPTYTIYIPTFSHHFLYGYSVMTIFFPLTLSGRPLFYYICFPDKKGMPSGIGVGTSLRVLYDHFYPLQGVSKTDCNEWTDILIYPQRGDNMSPIHNEDNSGGEMWEIYSPRLKGGGNHNYNISFILIIYYIIVR